ncbi:uncharacterized protein CYBJADRAFT_192017 [Cyberlindnera jadinii NRRL Y-1542]|uniref:Uncharacterized protein n=1 Tax=Cyberlindnera jadinii (strain ATCC 18201 / CBS 1600 / BCRC 20928 / JCM 3617 / NBRC 0987 / NRRL Y-1542) TaxID=983966 RepID=A0A1E4RW66_CYBJN|nr:hypothetical protein CYBJADRAFT_192017 [Cyberlindnera jadinii NRRL Y-1542]ODV71441.1 hypothetical protein CYBJADRAFT_192017 [Cyberlindnera jadinii NRRL Y-1542]
MKGLFTSLGSRLFFIALACGLPAGKPHANANGLADSNDEYNPTGSTRCSSTSPGASEGTNTGNPTAVLPEVTTPASTPEVSGEYADETLVWTLTIPSTYGPLKSVSITAEKKPYIRDDYNFTNVELIIDGKSTEEHLFTNITDDQVYANYSGAFAEQDGSFVLNIYADPYAEYEWSAIVQVMFILEDGTYEYMYANELRISAPDMPSTTSMLPTASPVLSGYYVDDELTWEVEFPGAAGIWTYVSVWLTRNGTEYDGYNFTDAAGYIDGVEVKQFSFYLYGPSTGRAYCYENPDEDGSLILLFNTGITNGTVWVATADITVQARDQEGSYVWPKVRATVTSTSASPSSASSSSVSSSSASSSSVSSSSVSSSTSSSSSVSSSSVSSSTANLSSKISSSIPPEMSSSSTSMETQSSISESSNIVRPTSTPSANDFDLSGFQEGEVPSYSSYGDLVWTLTIPENLGPWISLYVTFSNNGTENNQYSYNLGLGYIDSVNTFNQSMLTPDTVAFQVPGNISETNIVNFAVSGEPYPDTSIWTSIVTILMEVPYDTRLSKRSSFLEWTLEATIEGNATNSSSEALISSSTVSSSMSSLLSSEESGSSSVLEPSGSPEGSVSELSEETTSSISESVQSSSSQTSVFTAEAEITSTSTIEDISTTVITVTSCDEDVCITTGVTTGVVIITITENGIVSSYTTYCPTTTEFDLRTTVITVTSCEEDICTKIPVTTGITTITTTENGKLATYTTFCEVPQTPKVYTQVVTSTVESCVGETCSEVPITKTIKVTVTTSIGEGIAKTSKAITETVTLEEATITRASTMVSRTGIKSGEEITQALPVSTKASITTNVAGSGGATTSSNIGLGSTGAMGTVGAAGTTGAAESEIAITTFEGSAPSVISNSILAIAIFGLLLF